MAWPPDPDWVDMGTITVTPEDVEVLLPNPYTLGLDDNVLMIGTQGPELVEPWPFSFGLVSFEIDDQSLFGTAKVFASPTAEVYKLSSGLPPVERTGRLKYRPRSFNLGWVSQEVIQPLTLQFWCTSYNDKVVAPLGGGTNSTYVTPSGDRYRFKNVDGDKIILQL